MFVGTQARGETKADLIRLADEQQIPMVSTTGHQGYRVLRSA